MTARINTENEGKIRIDSDVILDVVSVYCNFDSMIIHTEHDEMFIYRQRNRTIEKWNDKTKTSNSIIYNVISVEVR